MSRFRLSLIAGALVALAACDEAAAPKGTPGVVKVRAYVDKNGNGAWNAGVDSAIAGVQVSATPTGGSGIVGTAATATTADSGVAILTLEPGTYTLSLGANAPSGSAVILLTNPTPQVAVSQQGLPSSTPEFRYALNAGRISGRIYRDENGNSTWDQGTDTPGAGLAVAIRRSVGGTAADTVALLTTDEFGMYMSGPLPLGSYFVQFENPGSITYSSPEIAPASVTGGTTLTVGNTFTGSLILPTSTVRARADGSQVAVLGTVIAAPGQITANVNVGGVRQSEIWIQDAAGGIAVFPVPTSDSLTYPIGQRVLVTGVRSNNGGAAQVGTTAAPPTLALRSGGTVVAPVTLTGTQVNALGTNEGRLVTLAGFTVTSVTTASTTSGAFTVNGTTPDGQTVQVRVTGPVTVSGTTYRNNGIATTDFVVGNRYTITGVLSRFTSGNPATTVAQIKTRQRSDVSGPTAIGTVRASAQGSVYTVSGTVIVAPSSFPNGTNAEVWIQDATGGIAVFGPTANYPAGLALGDRVEVTGTLGNFSNQLQLATTPTITKVGTGAQITPRDVTAADLTARTYEGQLVRIPAYTVTAVGTVSAAGAFTVTGTTGDGRVTQVRVNGSPTGLTAANFAIGTTYSVTGVATINGTNVQIKPRFRADVNP